MTSVFQLTSDVSGSIQSGPDASALAEVRVPLNGHSTKTVKKKALVSPGTLVAEHPDAGKGAAHSPVVGTVTDITANAVIITPGIPAPKKEGEEPPTPPAVDKIDLAGASGDELVKGLAALGVSTAGIAGAKTVIINGLNPEPGMCATEQLLGDAKPTLEKGVEALGKLAGGARIVLVTADGSGATLSGVTAFHVKPVYPNSIDKLVAAAVTGSEKGDGAVVISVAKLNALGAAYSTGLPVIDTVVTVNGANYKVAVGVPVGAVLQQAGAVPGEGDKVVLGGTLRGEAVCDMNLGLGKCDSALFVIPAGAYPEISDQACLNCGECVLHCPSRIMPNLLGRYAEFKMWDLCEKADIEACVDCGLCGYYCTARRPMMQYLRMAKDMLAAKKAAEAAKVAEQLETKPEA